MRILVVDDNRDAAESLTTLLCVWGHDARAALNGASALEIAPEFAPSVVFLDISMPRMDGYEVARRLRRIPALQHALLVAVTGYGRDDDRRKAEEAGFDLHVTKPIEPSLLPSLLEHRPATG
jgi:two-component system CheB/CheR fusion protein